jgi:penicillin G amidase
MSHERSIAGSAGRVGFFTAFPMLSRILCFVIIPIAMAIGGGIFWLRQSLPPDHETLEAPDLSGSVQIARDAHGVVSIQAETDADAFFALGYAQAEDRMWQLELERRTAQGRLSEIFGQGTVREDVWMRTLGIYESARQSWPALSPQARASLLSYTAGINAWLKRGPVLPVEFLLLDVKPAPWSEIDSLAWAKVFALSLGGNMWTEVENVVARSYLDRDRLSSLLDLRTTDADPVNAARKGFGLEAVERLVALQERLQNTLKIGGRDVGSNAWVVSGKLMEGGAPVLCNDTHLQLQMPSAWYVVRVAAKSLNVSGMALVGLPVVIFGRNAHLAWGGTNMKADAQDLHLEQLNPDRPDEYLASGEWTRFATRTEQITVRREFPSGLRGPPRQLRVQIRTTRNGPIVSDALGLTDAVYSLRWVALDQPDTSYESFYRIDFAQDWPTFRNDWQYYAAPALNILYADRKGNIASLGVGKIPVRVTGDGQLPTPGWSSEYQWKGYIPFDAMPLRYNPDSGYLISANDKNVDDGYPYFISADWAPPDRARRIEELLQRGIRSGKPLSVEFLEKIQGDTLDESAERLARLLVQIARRDAAGTMALTELSGWHGEMTADSTAAAIFQVWKKYLQEQLLGDAAQGYWNRPQDKPRLTAIMERMTNEQIRRALSGETTGWCIGGNSEESRSCRVIVRRSLDAALAELRKTAGTNVRSWRWGDIHTTVYTHQPFSAIETLAAFFERRQSNGGSENTINVANSVYHEATGYEDTSGPTFRQIMQMGESSTRHLYMNSTGESGNALSRHYDDMVAPFMNLQYYALDTADRG